MAKKKLTKKIKGLIKRDMWVSVAAVSILLNLFFVVGAVLFATTSSLDSAVYRAGYNNLCDKNYAENLNDRMNDEKDEAKALRDFEVLCLRGDFEPYYLNAVEAYLSDYDD